MATRIDQMTVLTGPESMPNWGPILMHSGHAGVDEYMWMYAYTIAGKDGRHEAYKHIASRRYLYLDADGFEVR